jgi:Flp pilus assembly protein TadG
MEVIEIVKQSLFCYINLHHRKGRSLMMRRFQPGKKGFFKHADGASAVEFAIILPVMMLLMLGGMDLGHAFYMQHVITNASREGARYGANYTGNDSPTTNAISTYVKTTLNYNSFNFNSLTVDGTYSGTSPSKIVTVTVQAKKYWWLLGTVPGFTNPKQLTATTAMLVEGP